MIDNELNDSSEVNNQSHPLENTSNLIDDVNAYEQNIMSSVPWGALGVATESIDETVMNFQRKK